MDEVAHSWTFTMTHGAVPMSWTSHQNEFELFHPVRTADCDGDDVDLVVWQQWVCDGCRRGTSPRRQSRQM